MMNMLVRQCLLIAVTLGIASTALAVTPGLNWKDSYSVNGQCYCDTTYDHETGGIIVATPAGNRTVRQICEKIGPGPGAADHPIYNDVQCGHGPPNNAIDEVLCPGRVDMGSAGCQVKGPTWNLDNYYVAQSSSDNTPEPTGSTAENNSSTDSGSTEPQSGAVPPTTNTSEPATDTQVQPEPQPEPEPEPEPEPAPQPEQPAEQASESGKDTPTESPPNTNTVTASNGSENAAQSTDAATGGSTTQPTGLAIAATDFTSKDNRWVLVDRTTVQTALGQDPDGPHINSALNGRYLELLPDSKVNDADQITTDNVWTTPGDGPQVQFDVNVEKAGEYAVFVHAFSTGEFDDTIHVGYDGLFPESGANINTCGTRGRWIWSDCGDNTLHTITFPSSGIHTVQFAAGDDGFEFDQFVLQPLQDGAITLAINNTDTQNGELETQNAIDGIPELGKAVVVGGSIAFGSHAITTLFISLLLLIPAVRFKTARNAIAKARSDQPA